MPGNVSNTSPIGVMPQNLCLSFSEERSYEVIENQFHDGTKQIGQLAQTSRKTFKLTRRLIASDLVTLNLLWLVANAGLRSFFFYNPFEGSPVGSNFDATGSNTVGRYTVKFKNNWSQATEFQRTNTSVELEEVN